MPIGFDDDVGGGGGGAPPATAPPPAADPLDPWAHGGSAEGDSGWSEPVAEDGGSWAWVEVESEEVVEVIFERWDANLDNRLCPECGALDGTVWEQGEGSFPPLHANCRCERVYDHSEWQTRTVTVWEQRWVPA